MTSSPARSEVAVFGGGLEARTINGAVRIDLSALGSDPVDMRTTNGAVELSLPRAANGAVDAYA